MTVLHRAVRTPLLWLAVVVLVLASLMLLERSGQAAPTRVLNGVTSVAHTAPAKPAAKPAGTPRHCTDGHGADNTHNKHCPGYISHG